MIFAILFRMLILRTICMKYLTIMRHAKSSWLDMTIDDFDRSLNTRGEKDGPRMNTWLKKHKIRPELILCSPAKRACQTLKALGHLTSHARETRYVDDIYEASVFTLATIVQAIPDTINHAMLIGHNPGLTDLACYVSDDKPARMVTSALLIFELTIPHWSDTGSNCGSILTRVWPKLLKK